MNFEQVWDQLKRKRPALEKPEAVVELTADNFRRLLAQVYEQGERAGNKRAANSSADPEFPNTFRR